MEKVIQLLPSQVHVKFTKCRSIEGMVIDMAIFLAHRILAGKYEYKKVPKTLKKEVKKILIEEGHPELAA